MTRNLMVLGCALLLAVGLSFSSFAGSSVDTDSDGVPDQYDNCTTKANGPLLGGCSAQEDTDQDGFGNSCDADWDDDGAVGGTDFAKFSAAFGSMPGDGNWNPLVDTDCDSAIGGTDFAVFSGNFPPGVNGPSGLACADSTNATAPCEAS